MNLTAQTTIHRRGVTSPVFWGSFIGILVGSIIAGLSYLGLIGPQLEDISENGVINTRPTIVIFCCLLCIRYYASIIFLTYDDTASPRLEILETKARRVIFVIQLLLIVGCSLNIALLPLYGAAVATGVILVQALLVVEYWRRLWRILLVEGPQARFRVVIAIGDFAILGSALMFFIWENNWATYNETGAGMCIGVIIFVFIVECVTTYYDSMRAFILDTLHTLGICGSEKTRTESN